MPENIFKIPHQDKLYIYNKFKKRLNIDTVPDKFKPLPFYFFGSGSSGNSVYLNKLHSLIDLGFSYKKYTSFNQNFFLDVDYIFLTHEHTDHFKFPTFYKILQMNPNVQFVLSKRLYDVITNPDQETNKIAKQVSGNFDQKINSLSTTYRDRFLIIQPDQHTSIVLPTRHQLKFWFTPHLVTHGDILNMAIELISENGIHTLYSSDIDHLIDDTGNDEIRQIGLPVNYSSNYNIFAPDFVPFPHAVNVNPSNNPFDLMFLEANYDEQLLDEALKKDPNNPHALGNKRHISEQEAWKYVNLSLANHGIFVPLHASRTFGTLIQELDWRIIRQPHRYYSGSTPEGVLNFIAKLGIITCN